MIDRNAFLDLIHKVQKNLPTEESNILWRAYDEIGQFHKFKREMQPLVDECDDKNLWELCANL